MKILKRCVKRFRFDNAMKLQMLILASFVLAECQLPDHSMGIAETDRNFTCPPKDDIRPCQCTMVPSIPVVHCERIRSLKTMNSALGQRFRIQPIPYLRIVNAGFVGLPSQAFSNISVTRLEIRDSNLRYVSGDAFFGLDSLLILILHNVRLFNFPSESLNQLSALITLSLPSNSIFGLGQEHLSSVGGLKYLSLEENELTRLERGTFPFSLVTLSLSNNRLISLNKAIRNLPNLEWLFLNHNRLSSVEGEFNGLHSLSNLKLANNKIRRLGHSLRRLHRLHFLELQNNIIVEIGSSLRTLCHLKKLNLSMNQLIHLSYDNFVGLPQLESLDLSGNRLEALNGALRSLSSLTSVDLSRNALQNFSIGEICFQSQLSLLDLSHNRLVFLNSESDDFTLPSVSTILLKGNRLRMLGNFFRHFPNLGEVDISNNQLRILSADDFTASNTLHYIDVLDNPLICDAEQMTVYQQLENLNIEIDGMPRCSADPRYL